ASKPPLVSRQVSTDMRARMLASHPENETGAARHDRQTHGGWRRRLRRHARNSEIGAPGEIRTPDLLVRSHIWLTRTVCARLRYPTTKSSSYCFITALDVP